ncbi:MAG: ABC-2 family transporter protein, partial [Chloroflexota bacterium]
MLRLYGEGLLLRLKEYREHRLDTWLRLVTRLVRFGVQLAFIGVAFSFVDNLGGWNVWHVVLMWSVGMAGRYFMEGLFCFANMAKVYLFDGGLDYVRVRPAPTFFFASARDLQLEETANAIVFLVIGGIAAGELHLLGQPVVLVFLLVGVAASTLVWLGIAFTISCAAAWFGRVGSVWQGLSAMYEHAKYPLDILPLPLQVMLTVVPFAFTAYYPVVFALRATEMPALGLVPPA